ncbi:MAG TPA: HD domain-containing protein [Acidimicrobiales bacterium]|nr:HD domain-containing protein [Acidimicrobiales bacterium]
MERLGRPGRRAERFMAQLESLSSVCDGGEVSELVHALQTATRAERSGADDEVVLGALFHDIGKVFGDAGHQHVSADLLGPHVRSEVVAVVRHHTAFTARHWDPTLSGRRDPRHAFVDQVWYPLAERFVDEWDMQSFDPRYEHHTLEHFAPLVHRLVIGP